MDSTTTTGGVAIILTILLVLGSVFYSVSNSDVTNNINPDEITEEDKQTELLKKNVNDIAIFISFCSPLIVTLSIFTLTLYLSIPGKGLLYLVFILLLLAIRIAYFSLTGIKSVESNNAKCNQYGLFTGTNITLSTYVLAFTFFYLCFPMFVTNSVNIGIIGMFIFYFTFDILVKNHLSCFNKKDSKEGSGGTNEFFMYVIGDFLSGSLLGLVAASTLFFLGGQNFLLLTEIQSNKVTCSRPSSQTFKCNVYKNGTLVQSKIA